MHERTHARTNERTIERTNKQTPSKHQTANIHYVIINTCLYTVTVTSPVSVKRKPVDSPALITKETSNPTRARISSHETSGLNILYGKVTVKIVEYQSMLGSYIRDVGSPKGVYVLQ